MNDEQTKARLVARAEEILAAALPKLRDRDDALEHLYYLHINDATRLHSIAAAVYVLRLYGKVGA